MFVKATNMNIQDKWHKIIIKDDSRCSFSAKSRFNIRAYYPCWPTVWFSISYIVLIDCISKRANLSALWKFVSSYGVLLSLQLKLGSFCLREFKLIVSMKRCCKILRRLNWPWMYSLVKVDDTGTSCLVLAPLLVPTWWCHFFGRSKLIAK